MTDPNFPSFGSTQQQVTLEEEKHVDLDDIDGHGHGHGHGDDGHGHGHGHHGHGHHHLTDAELNWKARIFLTIEEPDFRYARARCV